MSLVGPRPEQVELVERYADGAPLPAAGQARADGTDAGLRPRRTVIRRAARRRARLRREPGLGRDLRILGMTVAVVIKGRGAF